MKKSLLAASVLIAGFALSPAAFAQTAPVTTTNGTTGGDLPTNIPSHGRIDEVNQRDDNQQNRIDSGEADGQLNKAQAARDQAHLDHQEAVQQKQEAADGGHLTKREDIKDNQSLNASSNNIYKEKHITNVGGHEPVNIPGHPGISEVDKRDNNQEKRIDQGEADGQLSKAQGARDQAHLDHEEAIQRKQEAANGGHLTKGEYQQDNKSLNKSSGKIHRQRHAGRNKK
jgi:hypothetical protein